MEGVGLGGAGGDGLRATPMLDKTLAITEAGAAGNAGCRCGSTEYTLQVALGWGLDVET